MSRRSNNILLGAGLAALVFLGKEIRTNYENREIYSRRIEETCLNLNKNPKINEGSSPELEKNSSLKTKNLPETTLSEFLEDLHIETKNSQGYVPRESLFPTYEEICPFIKKGKREEYNKEFEVRGFTQYYENEFDSSHDISVTIIPVPDTKKREKILAQFFKEIEKYKGSEKCLYIGEKNGNLITFLSDSDFEETLGLTKIIKELICTWEDNWDVKRKYITPKS